jgi:hypothetical protein
MGLNRILASRTAADTRTLSLNAAVDVRRRYGSDGNRDQTVASMRSPPVWWTDRSVPSRTEPARCATRSNAGGGRRDHVVELRLAGLAIDRGGEREAQQRGIAAPRGVLVRRTSTAAG